MMCGLKKARSTWGPAEKCSRLWEDPSGECGMNQGGKAPAGVGERESGAKALTGKVGLPMRIHLWEDRTRGELWVPSYDPQTMPLVEDDFLRIASGNAVDTGRRTFEFRTMVAGTHRVVFEKRMGWKFTAEDRQVFYVTVS